MLILAVKPVRHMKGVCQAQQSIFHKTDIFNTQQKTILCGYSQVKNMSQIYRDQSGDDITIVNLR